jgi:hypothetical protein
VSARRIVGLSLGLVAGGLMMAALMTPWFNEVNTFTSCYDYDDCLDGTVHLAYGANELQADYENDEEFSYEFHIDYGDLESQAGSVDGTGRAIAGNVLLIVGLSVFGVGLLLALIGFLLHGGLGLAGSIVAMSGALAWVVGAVLLTLGIVAVNQDLAGQPDPNDPEYVEGDASQRRGLRPFVATYLGWSGAGLSLVAGGLTFGRNAARPQPPAPPHGLPTPPPYPTPSPAVTPPPAPAARAQAVSDWTALRCPRCQQQFRAYRHQPPQCPGCGFSGRSGRGPAPT